ncbi:MAG: Dam family site-specific DNA-(adenine-N6)-methyltransferase [Dehalococcoidales bacterium]|jgi:DNA adenine methylase
MNKNIPKRSPLFYVGDKYKLMKQISQLFPCNINTFLEPFVGGGTVFLNVKARKYILNDIDSNLIGIHRYLVERSKKAAGFYYELEKIVKLYNLSRSYKEDVVPSKLKKRWEKTYYARFNKEGYEKLRGNYNNASKKNPLVLYMLLIYGFNRMLRFNRNGHFNLPVGNVDFNKNVVAALNEYFNTVKTRNILFKSIDFRSFLKSHKYSKNDFIYLDPPYLTTFSEYNKLWNEKSEKDLLAMIDVLDKQGVRFALSNVTHYNGDKNKILLNWMQKYYVHKIRSNYISYHNNSTKKEITEVLITNYE